MHTMGYELEALDVDGDGEEVEKYEALKQASDASSTRAFQRIRKADSRRLNNTSIDGQVRSSPSGVSSLSSARFPYSPEVEFVERHRV